MLYCMNAANKDSDSIPVVIDEESTPAQLQALNSTQCTNYQTGRAAGFALRYIMFHTSSDIPMGTFSVQMVVRGGFCCTVYI